MVLNISLEWQAFVESVVNIFMIIVTWYFICILLYVRFCCYCCMICIYDERLFNSFNWMIGMCVIISYGQYAKIQCRCNAVNFLQNIHEWHPIARPSGRAMGCLLWVQPLINILPQFLQWCVSYHVMLGRVTTALDCIWTQTAVDML